jgi:hypothetical protein
MAEIGISYSTLHYDAGSYPIGWVFAVGGNITNSMAIVGEVGGGLLWLLTPRVGVRGEVRGRAAFMEPESVPWWTYVRSTIGLTVAF